MCMYTRWQRPTTAYIYTQLQRAIDARVRSLSRSLVYVCVEQRRFDLYERVGICVCACVWLRRMAE